MLRPAPTTVACMLMALMLGGCQTMSNSGPTGLDVTNSASSYVPSGPQENAQYVLIDMSTAVAYAFAPEGGRGSPLTGAAPPPSSGPQQRLGVGDVVELTVYEAEAGGLFVPADNPGRAGNYIKLPQQRIEAAGAITVPYIGSVQAAGRTRVEVQNEIRKRLDDIAIEPEVMLTVISSNSSHVSVLGDVAQPTQLTLNPAGDRLLDVVARAGGLRQAGDDANITVQRAGQTFSVRFSTLISDPKRNVFLAAGDTVFVRADARSYTVLGATDKSGNFAFERPDTTLAEALAKAGGLSDQRASSAYVFLYREVDRNQLLRFGVDLSQHPEPRVPVIFHANLRDPSVMFATNRFRVQDRDILYVSNAEGYDFQKFVTLLNGMTTIAWNAAYVATGNN